MREPHEQPGGPVVFHADGRTTDIAVDGSCVSQGGQAIADGPSANGHGGGEARILARLGREADGGPPPPTPGETADQARSVIRAHADGHIRERERLLRTIDDQGGVTLEAMPLGTAERAALATAAEDASMWKLAGRVRWGQGGMIQRLASQPRDSTRSYHGIRVDRLDNGDFTVHHPPGTPRHTNARPADGMPAGADPNLASPEIAEDSILGALSPHTRSADKRRARMGLTPVDA